MTTNIQRKFDGLKKNNLSFRFILGFRADPYGNAKVFPISLFRPTFTDADRPRGYVV